MPIFQERGETMAGCNHVFIGKADGVHCAKCGLHLSAEEYAHRLKPPEEKSKAPKCARKKKEEKPSE